VKSRKDFWQAEVTKMIKTYGAPIDDSDVPRIVEYLAATY
jgi:predicted RNase H-like nuclease (RuvC/YqgF family)